MTWICEVINLVAYDFRNDYYKGEFHKDEGRSFDLHFAKDQQDYIAQFESGQIIGLAIVADEYSPGIEDVVKSFSKYYGPYLHQIAIICDDPDPQYIADLWDLGIENIFPKQTWEVELRSLCAKIALEIQHSSELYGKIRSLNLRIGKGESLGDFRLDDEAKITAQFDYRTSYTLGRLFEATGKHDKSAEFYAKTRDLNISFRPAQYNLIGAYKKTGNFSGMEKISESLYQTNPENATNTYKLGQAYLLNNKVDQAKGLLPKLEGKDKKLANMLNVEILIKSPDSEKVIEYLDSIDEISDECASLLNEQGIKLAQQGKAKDALALYERAHRLVREQTKYKVSYNAALACYRMKAFKHALQYINRCEEEFGKPFPKLKNLRDKLEEVIAKSNTAKSA